MGAPSNRLRQMYFSWGLLGMIRDDGWPLRGPLMQRALTRWQATLGPWRGDAVCWVASAALEAIEATPLEPDAAAQARLFAQLTARIKEGARAQRDASPHPQS